VHDLSYQYIGVALALLLAFGNTVARWGGVIQRLHASPPEAEPLSAWVGLYKALARLSA
jgi:hypothetical protein